MRVYLAIIRLDSAYQHRVASQRSSPSRHLAISPSRRIVGRAGCPCLGCRRVCASRLSDPDTDVTQCFLGHSQIVSADGKSTARAEDQSGPSVLVADLPVETEQVDPLPSEDAYWIPELTEARLKRWETDSTTDDAISVQSGTCLRYFNRKLVVS